MGLGILSLVIVITISVLIMFRYNKYATLKKQEDFQQQISFTARQTQKSFSDHLKKLLNQGLIEMPHKQGLLMLINNYFVYQPINEFNFNLFIELHDTLVNSITKILTAPANTKQEAAKEIHELAAKLPNKTAGYSATFYMEKAPVLVGQFSVTVDKSLAGNKTSQSSQPIEAEQSKSEHNDSKNMNGDDNISVDENQNSDSSGVSQAQKNVQ